MYTIAYFINDNVSSFKIKGDYTNVSITPVGDCTIDFGDGTIENIPAGIPDSYGNYELISPIQHTYNVSGEYIVKIAW